MNFYAGTLFILLMLAFVNTGDSQAFDKKYLFVSYGHAAQVNCNLRENDLNVTLYVKRYNPTARKVVVDNVKWTEQNGLFTMQGVRPLDGGNYFCKVVNISGHERITTKVYVIPIVAPSTNKFKLDVTPHSVSLHYEDYANISCSSFGKRELKWYKIGPREKLMDVDDEDIIDDDHYDTDGGTRLYHSRLILSLKDVTNQNAGRYKCIARSNGQELAKNVVVIVRNPKKPVIRHFPPVVIASEGISVTIKCKIKGSPRPKMTWYKDDRLLGICEGGRSQKCQSFTKLKTEFKKNTITLHRLSYRRNDGTYTCEVENFVGKALSSTKLNVFSKPKLSKRSDINFNKIVSIYYSRSRKSPAILRCKVVSGNPKPVISWEFQSFDCLKNTFACKPKEQNWKKFVNGGKKEHEFVVQPPFGAGFYRCVATNLVSRDYQVFAVTRAVNDSSRRRYL